MAKIVAISRRYKGYKILMLLLCLHGEIFALVIQCAYEYDLVYICHGQVVDAESNSEITDVLGDHIGNRSLPDVDSVRIVAQGLTEFPKNIQNFFPKVTNIDLARNRITHVTNSHIRSIPKLRDLVLWGNRITELEGNLFEGMCHIKFVDLDRNEIQHIGYDFEFPKDGLLFMQHNPCIHMTVFGTKEVRRLNSIFRSKCPPVGAEPYIPETTTKPNNENVIEYLESEDLYYRMILMEERLEILEAKLSNAIEIRIGEKSNDKKSE